MEIIDALEQSWALGANLIGKLDDAHLTRPTPCAGWDVRALLNHTLGEAVMMSAVNRGEPSVHEWADVVDDDANLVQLWTAIGADNVASWRTSGLGGERTYFYGTFPARASALINLGEVVVHTGDLAEATGIDAPMDPDHAALVYSLYSAFPLDGMRSSGQLGPEVPVPEGAPIGTRLLGLLGRDAR
ncbi:MAG: TIGR03086 family metal-binding protein [Jatrophihabitans sp.]|uniref:TIGR03086 family metal-binding protein n=1 Tax=Jatrophihabitans sp. TaxID=1932789 RepID=UPI00390DB914